MEQVVGSAAARTMRRVWWAEREEVEQVARLAILSARPHFDPRVGVPLNAYLRGAVRKAVGKALWEISSPVKAAYGKGAGLHRAALDDGFVDPRPAPDEEVHRERWRNRVLSRLHEMATSDPILAIGLEVMLLEVPVREYALRTGLSRREVYACERETRRAIYDDPELYSLWSDRP